MHICHGEVDPTIVQDSLVAVISAAAWLKKQISIVISAALNSRAIFQSNRLKKSQTSAIQALAQIQILRGNSAEIGVWPNFRATRIDFGKFFRSF